MNGRSHHSVCGGSVPQLGNFKLPDIKNEPMVTINYYCFTPSHAITSQNQLNYSPGSPERAKLDAALKEMRASLEKNGPFQVPIVINGKKV